MKLNGMYWHELLFRIGLFGAATFSPGAFHITGGMQQFCGFVAAAALYLGGGIWPQRLTHGECAGLPKEG